MIGVFDSGYGGLTILHGLIETLPQYAYVYLGDNARAPYGSRSAAEITEFTRQGVQYLFNHGCPLVIVGCNTASAVALRELQQEFLAQHYPDRRILGIVVPTIEQITQQKQVSTIGLLATEQTVASGSYAQEIKKRNPLVQLVQQAAPDLVTAIEQGQDRAKLHERAQGYIDQLVQQAEPLKPALQALVLGCTHFEIMADIIASLLPPGITLYEQPKIVALSLKNYLDRHPEMEAKLIKTRQQQFFTTGTAEEVSHHSSRYFGREISFEQVSYV